MIGVVIVTHGGLAHEFRAALEHVVGRQDMLETLSIGPEDDMEARRAELVAAIKRVTADKGVIVMTDMFGGTPSNLAINVMDETGAEVIAGVRTSASIRPETAFLPSQTRGVLQFPPPENESDCLRRELSRH